MVTILVKRLVIDAMPRCATIDCYIVVLKIQKIICQDK